MFHLTGYNMAEFERYLDLLGSHNIDLHPSELHGLLVGYLCSLG